MVAKVERKPRRARQAAANYARPALARPSPLCSICACAFWLLSPFLSENPLSFAPGTLLHCAVLSYRCNPVCCAHMQRWRVWSISFPALPRSNARLIWFRFVFTFWFCFSFELNISNTFEIRRLLLPSLSVRFCVSWILAIFSTLIFGFWLFRNVSISEIHVKSRKKQSSFGTCLSPCIVNYNLMYLFWFFAQVVDMALALEAVSLLEKTTVTKEALEVSSYLIKHTHL